MSFTGPAPNINLNQANLVLTDSSKRIKTPAIEITPYDSTGVTIGKLNSSTLDIQGNVYMGSNTITADGSNLTSIFPSTGTFGGSDALVTSIQIDGTGKVQSISERSITFANVAAAGATSGDTITLTNATTAIDATGNVETAGFFIGNGYNITHTTDVVSTSVGSATSIPTIIFDADGRISAVGSNTISTTLQGVVETGNAASNTIYLESNTIAMITDGRIGVANTAPAHDFAVGTTFRVDNTSGDIHGTYFHGDAANLTAVSDISVTTPFGDSANVAQITFDANGRISAISNVEIASKVTASTENYVAYYTGDGQVVGGDSGLIFNPTNESLTVGGTVNVGGDITVAGNLNITGNTTVTQNLLVEDPTLAINAVSNSQDLSIVFTKPYGNVAMGWTGDSSAYNGKLVFGYTSNNGVTPFIDIDTERSIEAKFFGSVTATSIISGSTNLGDAITVLDTDLTSNASRVTALESDMTSNASRVGTLETNLTSNASRIATNEGAITALQTNLTSNASRVGTLETDLTSNAARITVNEGAISTIQTDLSSNASRVTNNENDIGVLETNLTSNASRITTNEGAISTIQTNLSSNASRVGTLETDLTSNASRITTNEGAISTLQTDLTSNASRVGTLETDLTSNVSRIATNEGAISTLQTDMTSNAARIGLYESNVFLSGGNVGISEASPAASIHVSGNAFVTTDLTLGSEAQFFFDESATSLYIDSSQSITGNALVVADTMYVKDNNVFVDGNVTASNIITDAIVLGAGTVSVQSISLDDVVAVNGTTTRAITVGDINSTGTVSANIKSFNITHPIVPDKRLIHACVETARADNIYMGSVVLDNGRAEIDLDEVNNMTSGTFVALHKNVRVFTTNESDWDAVKGSVDGSLLRVECQNGESSAKVSWLVAGTRTDVPDLVVERDA